MQMDSFTFQGGPSPPQHKKKYQWKKKKTHKTELAILERFSQMWRQQQCKLQLSIDNAYMKQQPGILLHQVTQICIWQVKRSNL